MLKQILFRIALLIPWMLVIGLIAEGIAGNVSLLLVFVLLFVLIPGVIAVNLFTFVLFQGHSFMKVMRSTPRERNQEKQQLKSENYADLPWWDPRKYTKDS